MISTTVLSLKTHFLRDTQLIRGLYVRLKTILELPAVQCNAQVTARRKSQEVPGPVSLGRSSPKSQNRGKPRSKVDQTSPSPSVSPPGSREGSKSRNSSRSSSRSSPQTSSDLDSPKKKDVKSKR